MNILIAKIVVQSFVDEFNIPLLENDADKNFNMIYQVADDEDNEEITECLNFINNMGMLHMLANK